MPSTKDCLIQLGYSADHPLIKALDRNEAIDLNTPDENGFTPLRIAIQRRNEDVINALYQLEPNPKYLSQYDLAMIDEVVHHKKGTFKALLVPNHKNIICCIQALYSIPPKDTHDGVCFGIAQMRRRAVFAGETDLYRKRLKNITYNLWPLIEEAMTVVEKKGIDRDKDLVGFFKNVREMLQDRFPYHIWYDLYGFLDGVILYANSINFLELFERGAFLGQLALAAENLFSAEGRGVMSQHVFSGCYTRATLLTYFTCLDQAFKHLSHPISFLIQTGDHVFVIDYFQEKWVLTDANRLKNGEKEYDNQTITEILLKSNSEPLIFATTPFIAPNAKKSFNQSMTALKNDPNWISIHRPITQQQTNKQNRGGYDLLYIAAKHKDMETVIQCILAGTEFVPQGKDKFTPLHTAVYNRHLDVVKEILNALKDNIDKINQANTNGYTPLYIAAQFGFTSIVEALLNHGADIAKPIPASSQILLKTAKKQNCGEKLQQLFTEEKIGDTLPGFTPLHGAIAFGHDDTVKLLAERGATFTDTTSGISAYKFAVVMNRADLLPPDLKQQYSQLKEAMSFIKADIDLYLQKNPGTSANKDIESAIAYLTNENHFIDSGLAGLLQAITQHNPKFTGVSFKQTRDRITSLLQGDVTQTESIQATLRDKFFFTREETQTNSDDLNREEHKKTSYS